jgi:hypothetical protein
LTIKLFKKEWKNIKYYYPEIEYYDAPLPQWEKDFIDNRLSALNTHPEKIKPIENLFDNL